MTPQQKLYAILAEGDRRRQECDRIAKAARNGIPQQQQAMLPSIQQLRAHIQSVGVGGDPEAEQDYVDALTNFRRIGQVHIMGTSVPEVNGDEG